MVELNLFGKMWLGYMDKVIPKDAPIIQIQESKRAFYAGAISVWLMIVEKVAELPDNQAEMVMNNIDQELKAFKDSVGKEN